MKTTKWDMAAHIQTPDDVKAYLEAALAENDTELLLSVIGDIARSKGMAAIANNLHVARESLYRSLSPHGNPSFATVAGVLDTLGYRLRVEQKTSA
jgi:probable addiction module antidote protein